MRELRRVAGYGAMLGAAVAVFELICAIGERSGTMARSQIASHGSALVRVLGTLMLVIGLARLLGAAFRRLRQPAVIGEVLAGIALGPSLLDVVPADTVPHLGTLAQLGVILFMFVIGLELDLDMLRRRSHAAVAISHASIVVPFVFGGAMALWLYPRLAGQGVAFTTFAMFLGTSLSVTAFPVLARILADCGLARTELGAVALVCAAVDDATAWCLLALVVGLAQASASSALWTVLGTAAFVAVMVGVARPIIARRRLGGSRDALAVALLALLASALITEWIGIHALFGAFLCGAVIPHDSRLARELVTRLEVPATVLLLPAFFALVGLRTQIGLIGSVGELIVCLAIIGVASAGKIGATAVAARVVGMPWRDGVALGVLMNTRGLVELIVLEIGRELGVISPTLFAMLVVMALVTTFATTPLLGLCSDVQVRSRTSGTGCAPSAERGHET